MNPRVVCTLVYAPCTLALFVCTERWSVSFRCENVSLDFHSSVIRPP